MKARLLLYGVDSYAGGLISRRAAERGFGHIASGHDIARVATLANELSRNTPNLVEPRIFGLGDKSSIISQLDDVAVVVNCSPRFSDYSQALISACLASGTHYVSLGMNAHEYLQEIALNYACTDAKITLVPGVCFDVSAADALAARLATMRPNATQLTLAVARSPLSKNEAHELVAACRAPTEVLKDGAFVKAKPGDRSIHIDFGKGPMIAHLAPWRCDGLLAKQHGSFKTVDAYEVFHPALVRAVTKAGLRRWMFRRGMRIAALERKISGRGEGPKPRQLVKTNCVIWGEARDAAGHVSRARLETPAAPMFSADAAIIVARILMEGKTPSGVRSAAEVAGAALIEGIEGMHWRELPDAAEISRPESAPAMIASA
jgi:short subunit dehydrogenase-like uncharacterized protein